MITFTTTTGPTPDEVADHVDAIVANGPLLDAVARAGAELIVAGFSASRAPDGRPWAPLRAPRPGGGPLVRTGALRDLASRPEVDGDGVTWTSTRYGGFHQRGTRRLPARPFFPDGELSSEWEAAITVTLERALSVAP